MASASEVAKESPRSEELVLESSLKRDSGSGSEQVEMVQLGRGSGSRAVLLSPDRVALESAIAEASEREREGGETEGELVGDDTTPQKRKPTRREMLQTCYLGLCYAIVLCGYYAANSFVSVLYKDVYFWGWAMLYFFYFLSSFVSPSLGNRLPLKASIVACSVVYVAYIASINSRINAVFLVASAIIGTTAGLFWLKSSEWITRQSLKSGGGAEGALTGAFYGVFYFQGLLGTAVSLIVLKFGADTSMLIWCMCGLTAAGVVLTVFLPALPSDEDKAPPPVLKDKLRAIFRSSSQASVLLLFPIILLQSAQVCFSYQFMPRLVNAATGPQDFAFVNVVTFGCYWVGSIAVSFGYGKLFDRLGWRVVLVFVASIELAAIVTILCLMLISPLPTPYLWLIVGFLRGCSDTGLNAFVLATITLRYGAVGSASALFGLYRGLYSFGFFILGIVTGLLTPWFLVGGLATLLTAGTICYVLSFRFPAL